MAETVYTAKSIIGKHLLDLTEGSFLGYVEALLVNEDAKTITCLGVRVNEEEPLVYVDFKDIEELKGDVLTFSGKTTASTGTPILDFPVITTKGIVIGRVNDFAFFENGDIIELLLSGSYVEHKVDGRGVFSINQVEKIGKQAILTNRNEEALIFSEPAEDRYDARSSFSRKEIFENVTKKVADSIEGIGSKVKGLDSDMLTGEFGKFTDSLNREVGKLFDGIVDKVTNRKRGAFDNDLESIFQDVSGKTVRKPINDKNGEIIIMPGQLITLERVQAVIAADKVAELYRWVEPFDSPESEFDGHEKNSETK